MRPNNSHHLIAAAQRRRADTLQRAQKALQDLSKIGQQRTITQIAAHAGVSRSWLYAQPELRDQLCQLTAPHQPPKPAARPAEHSSEASLRQRLTLAYERIRELDNDNRQLRDQIAHLHGQLRANRLTTTPVTDTVHDANTHFKPPNSPGNPR